MNLWDILILLCLALAVVLALVRIRKDRARGCHGCGDCSDRVSLTETHAQRYVF